MCCVQHHKQLSHCWSILGQIPQREITSESAVRRMSMEGTLSTSATFLSQHHQSEVQNSESFYMAKSILDLVSISDKLFQLYQDIYAPQSCGHAHMWIHLLKDDTEDDQQYSPCTHPLKVSAPLVQHTHQQCSVSYLSRGFTASNIVIPALWWSFSSLSQICRSWLTRTIKDSSRRAAQQVLILSIWYYRPLEATLTLVTPAPRHTLPIRSRTCWPVQDTKPRQLWTLQVTTDTHLGQAAESSAEQIGKNFSCLQCCRSTYLAPLLPAQHSLQAPVPHPRQPLSVAGVWESTVSNKAEGNKS